MPQARRQPTRRTRPGRRTGRTRRPESGAAARRDAIREILARRTVASQDQLASHLASRGIRAAQATVSRDLGLLGVVRTATADGPRYRIPGDDGGLPLDPVRRLVDAVTSNGHLLVVRTKSGAASTVARAVDDAHLDGVLGTLAGDDTVFVAPTRERTAAKLALRLKRLLGV
jgi:transcriptional regulator of arginine metabolism